MDSPRILYTLTTIIVLVCIALAVYTTDGLIGPTCIVSLTYMFGVFIFLGLFIMLKMALQALLSQ